MRQAGANNLDNVLLIVVLSSADRHPKTAFVFHVIVIRTQGKMQGFPGLCSSGIISVFLCVRVAGRGRVLTRFHILLSDVCKIQTVKKKVLFKTAIYIITSGPLSAQISQLLKMFGWGEENGFVSSACITGFGNSLNCFLDIYSAHLSMPTS